MGRGFASQTTNQTVDFQDPAPLCQFTQTSCLVLAIGCLKANWGFCFFHPVKTVQKRGSFWWPKKSENYHWLEGPRFQSKRFEALRVVFSYNPETSCSLSHDLFTRRLFESSVLGMVDAGANLEAAQCSKPLVIS